MADIVLLLLAIRLVFKNYGTLKLQHRKVWEKALCIVKWIEI